MKNKLAIISILLSGCTISGQVANENSCVPSKPWVNGKPVANPAEILYEPTESERSEVFKQITDWPNYGLECWYKKTDGNLELYSEKYLDMVSYEFKLTNGSWKLLKKHEYIFLIH